MYLQRKRNGMWFAMRKPDNGAGSSGGNAGDGQPRSPDVPPTSWEEVFQHERFKQLLDRAKKAEDALEKQAKDLAAADQAKLLEQARFQELYEAEQKRAADLEQKLAGAVQRFDDARKRQAVESAALAHEPKFRAEALGDLQLFIPLDKLRLGEDGKVSGAEAAVRALAKDRPYMLEQRDDPGSPAGKRPAGQAQAAPGRTITL